MPEQDFNLGPRSVGSERTVPQLGEIANALETSFSTEEQVEAIEEASDIRVLTNKVNAWKTETGGWFIVDQVIGKHEMIDVAVAIDHQGKIIDLKIMKYIESYGSEVKHPKWLAQFHGRDSAEHLKLDQHIDNISGATLSARHITDGVNRWTHTWNQVLRHL